MGCIMTNTDELDRIRICDIKPGKLHKVEGVYRQGNTIIIKHDETQISICQAGTYHKFAFPMTYSSYPWQESLINALVKMGLVKKETADKVHAAVRLRDENRRKKFARESLEEMAKDWGFKITKEQKEKLNATVDKRRSFKVPE